MSETKPQNESARILQKIANGYRVEMWYCGDEETREINAKNGLSNVKIILSGVDDGNVGTVKETRVSDGDEIMSRTIGQPEISSLVKDRSWWSPKEN